MIDWYVMLTPLILVPIVLLLIFVGCTLNRDGLGQGMLWLRIGEGSFEQIWRLMIIFSIKLENGDSPSHVHIIDDKADMVEGAEFTFISETSWTKVDVVSTSITCFIVPHPQFGEMFVRQDINSVRSAWKLTGAPAFDLQPGPGSWHAGGG